MYQAGQRVSVNLNHLDLDAGIWVPGTIIGEVLGFENNLRKQYRVRLDTPLWNGNQHESDLDFSEQVLKVA